VRNPFTPNDYSKELKQPEGSKDSTRDGKREGHDIQRATLYAANYNPGEYLRVTKDNASLINQWFENQIKRRQIEKHESPINTDAEIAVGLALEEASKLPGGANSQLNTELGSGSSSSELVKDYNSDQSNADRYWQERQHLTYMMKSADQREAYKKELNMQYEYYINIADKSEYRDKKAAADFLIKLQGEMRYNQRFSNLDAMDLTEVRNMARNVLEAYPEVARKFASGDSDDKNFYPNIVKLAKEVSSQKSGADPLVNPGQKRHDESSSATFPPNIEMIQIIEKMPKEAKEVDRRTKELNVVRKYTLEDLNAIRTATNAKVHYKDVAELCDRWIYFANLENDPYYRHRYGDLDNDNNINDDNAIEAANSLRELLNGKNLTRGRLYQERKKLNKSFEDAGLE